MDTQYSTNEHVANRYKILHMVQHIVVHLYIVILDTVAFGHEEKF